MAIRFKKQAAPHEIMAKRFIQILKNCYSFVWNRQFLTFLGFLALSAAFWLFQSLNETYEESFSVPIELQGVPKEIVITTELPKSITVNLRDKGFNLLSYKYGQEFNPIVIEYTANNRGYVRLFTRDYIDQISSQLLSTTQLVGFQPDTLEYFYNFGHSKILPVKFTGSYTTEADFLVSHMELEPQNITVYAQKNILDTMQYAYTEPIYIGSLRDSLRTDVPMLKMRGVKYIPNKVSLRIQVDRMVEKTVDVPIRGVNFPASKALRTFPAKAQIKFLVGMKDYRRITENDFALPIHYEDLLENNTGFVTLQLNTIPEGVQNVRLMTNRVEYIIEEVAEND